MQPLLLSYDSDNSNIKISALKYLEANREKTVLRQYIFQQINKIILFLKIYHSLELSSPYPRKSVRLTNYKFPAYPVRQVL